MPRRAPSSALVGLVVALGSIVLLSAPGRGLRAQSELEGTWIQPDAGRTISRVEILPGALRHVAVVQIDCGDEECYAGGAGELVPAGHVFRATLPRQDGELRLTIIPLDEDSIETRVTFVHESEARFNYSGTDVLRRLRPRGVAFRRGDVNVDGSADISDAVAILGYLFLGDSSPSCFDAADANDDGGVDLSDASALLSHLFNGSAPPPAPFGSCGVDGTPDGLGCERYARCGAVELLVEDNPRVASAMTAFGEVRTHGDRLAFREGASFPGGYTWPSTSSHFQGMQRLREGHFFAVSGSSTSSAHVFIVRMASRPRAGRLRSNRFTAIPANDEIIRTIRVDDELHHGGGLQVIGDYLVVGAEGEVGGRDVSRIHFFDVSDPYAPRRLDHVIERSFGSAGACAIARRDDGRYVLLVGRTDSNIIDLYVSRSTTLEEPDFELLDTWREGELRSEFGQDGEFGNYQNLNLIQERTGRLFLVGLHRNAEFVGDDYIDLFRVDFEGGGRSLVITKVANRHLTCQDECNLDAGGGVYVDERGFVKVYGVEHWREDGIVKFNEFHRTPAQVETPLRDIYGAWVELFDDVGFSDRGIVIDWLDRGRRNFDDYDQVEGFEDKTSSAKWLLPQHWTYLLFEHKSGKGEMRKLIGTGHVESLPRFASFGWNDRVSSSRWVKEPILAASEGWIELYDDSGFEDRRLVIHGGATLPSIANYESISVEGQRGFGDKVSAARWQLPVGQVYRLYEHDTYRGRVVELRGTGHVEEIASFHSIDFNDKVSSSR